MRQEGPSRSVRWPLLRVLAQHETQVELLSGDWFRLSTHYFRRTVLCAESDLCPLCSLLPVRAYWYLPVVVLPTKQPAILEMSATASSAMEQNAKLLAGSIGPGVQFLLRRKSAKRPVYSEVVGTSEKCSRVSKDVWLTALMAIYLLPMWRVDEDAESYSARTLSMVIERANLVAASVKAAADRRPIVR